jgi:hypothetical protein
MNFIFFESWERYLKALEDDKDINYVNAVARAIIQYGLYGKCETQDQTVVRKVDAVCLDLMKSAKSRYAASVKNGSKGGRPTQYDPEAMRSLRDAGLTYQEIADNLGCTVRTVQRALSNPSEDEI